MHKNRIAMVVSLALSTGIYGAEASSDGNLVTSVVGLPDGRLASGSEDSSVKIWEHIPMGSTLQKLQENLDSLKEEEELERQWDSEFNRKMGERKSEIEEAQKQHLQDIVLLPTEIAQAQLEKQQADKKLSETEDPLQDIVRLRAALAQVQLEKQEVYKVIKQLQEELDS